MRRPHHGGEIVAYDREQFPFADHVRSTLGVTRLDRLHCFADYPLATRETDQQTVWHRLFYCGFPAWQALYRRFIREVVEPLFEEPLIYQRIPSCRVQLPGNLAVGEFHRDRDYDHPEGEVNLLVPLTAAWGSNTVWLESAPERGDYAPVPLAPGQAFLFNGWALRHGNRLNETRATRVSFDLRVIPLSRYQPSAGRSINTGTRFVVGGYYEFRGRDRVPGLLPDDLPRGYAAPDGS